MQMGETDDLDFIFNDDLFEVLKPKASTSDPVINEEQRLIQSFQEILSFSEHHHHTPNQKGSILEKRLFMRLKGFIQDPVKREFLRTYDTKEILETPILEEIQSIDDIFNDDPFGLLNSDAERIFDLKHVSKETTMPDYVASRKPCSDFRNFESLFIECHQNLKNGDRKLLIFRNEQQIEKGAFYVLKGILLYVAEIGKRELENGKTNARLRCIFENGTESDMLLRSLAAELYKDGRRVTEHSDNLLKALTITDEDKQTGFIYILKSLSKDPSIAGITDLYKIGFSTVPVEDRIKNAEKEPTYLMAPVSIISVFSCYNLNTQKLELILHSFFGKACLDLDVFDLSGKRSTPREWFIAPLEIIEQTVELIVSGEILNSIYDPDLKLIKPKS